MLEFGLHLGTVNAERAVGFSSYDFPHLRTKRVEAGHGLLDSISNLQVYLVLPPPERGMNVVGDILESKGWAVVQLSDSDALCLPGTASTPTTGHALKDLDP